MGVTNTSWGPNLQQESNKFWFYALTSSLLLSMYQIFLSSALFTKPAQSTTTEEVGSTSSEKNTEEKLKAKSSAKSPGGTPPGDMKQVYKQFFMDGCDILIPGSVVGWIPADAVTVGVAMSLSSYLSARQIWLTVNSNKAQ
jgi:hypothetical protein